MTKQVTIYLSRPLTLTRAGQDSIPLTAGRNVVDEEVAKHPFVHAHTTEAVDATPDEVAGLRARVAELEAELAALKAKPGRKAKGEAESETAPDAE